MKEIKWMYLRLGTNGGFSTHEALQQHTYIVHTNIHFPNLKMSIIKYLMCNGLIIYVHIKISVKKNHKELFWFSFYFYAVNCFILSGTDIFTESNTLKMFFIHIMFWTVWAGSVVSTLIFFEHVQMYVIKRSFLFMP